MDDAALAEQVLRRCRDLGFAHAGICRAEPTAHDAALRRWLDSGRHGEMEYLQRHADVRVDPRRLVDGARSIICVADRHDAGDERPGGPGRGRVARYARGDDYHKIMRRRLHELCDELRANHPAHVFRAAVDTAPILEREHAERAGLGAVGKHTLLIRRGEGSYLLIGGIVTTLPLRPSAAAEPDPCGSCTRCIDACPTRAITPWSVDATVCISYLTIEHRSVIEPDLHEPMGDWIFGCDICQEVCPHNQPTRRSADLPVPAADAPRNDAFDLLEVLGWTEADRRAAFTRSAMKRARLAMMKRNAMIAAGNALADHDRPELRASIEALADDQDEMVRITARQTLRRLDTSGPGASRQDGAGGVC